MSGGDDAWNPDDGPPPTDDERAEATRLTEALERSDAPADPDLRDLVAVARRVHSTAHPDRDAQAAVVRRVTEEVVAAASPVATPLRRVLRYAAPWSVAAAALLIAGVTFSRRPEHAHHPVPSISRDADDVLRAPVPANASSGPSAQIYDARLAAWRDLYLRGAAR